MGQFGNVYQRDLKMFIFFLAGILLEISPKEIISDIVKLLYMDVHYIVG